MPRQQSTGRSTKPSEQQPEINKPGPSGIKYTHWSTKPSEPQPDINKPGPSRTAKSSATVRARRYTTKDEEPLFDDNSDDFKSTLPSQEEKKKKKEEEDIDEDHVTPKSKGEKKGSGKVKKPG